MPAPTSGVVGFDKEQHEAMLALLADLRYPVGPDATVMLMLPRPDDLEAVTKAFIAYHLVRCGWRPDMSRRKIKAREVYGQGMFDDACTWQDIDAPDDPLANLSQMSMAQIEALEPEDLRLEARRRLGLPINTPEPAAGWTQSPLVNITDQPEETP